MRCGTSPLGTPCIHAVTWHQEYTTCTGDLAEQHKACCHVGPGCTRTSSSQRAVRTVIEMEMMWPGLSSTHKVKNPPRARTRSGRTDPTCQRQLLRPCPGRARRTTCKHNACDILSVQDVISPAAALQVGMRHQHGADAMHDRSMDVYAITKRAVNGVCR